MRARSFFLRILWSPAFFVAVMIFMDVLLPFSETDTAVVKEKNVSSGKDNSKSYEIKAEGSISYNEPVSKSFYDQVHINDELIIKRTYLFKEWRSVELIKDGSVVAASIGVDIYYMPMFALFFLAPIVFIRSKDSFVEYLFETKPTEIKIFILVMLLELTAVLILIKLLLVFLGYAESI